MIKLWIVHFVILASTIVWRCRLNVIADEVELAFVWIVEWYWVSSIQMKMMMNVWLVSSVLLYGDKLGCMGLIVDYFSAMAVIGVVI